MQPCVYNNFPQSLIEIKEYSETIENCWSITDLEGSFDDQQEYYMSRIVSQYVKIFDQG